ncbi:unnamed protein product [Periconia digitata]|uniref:C2H2-type domain-containing protein n=1 Tax=Periconia digitata TaxID=1303443 RepID=A0A9W4XWT5_9PLEO|nr:unnamed protein product [Periconia digitata]
MGIKRSRQDSVSSSDHLPSLPTSREQSVDNKILHLDSHQDRPAVMKCSLPPHPPLEFQDYDDYHVHYQQSHLNRCSECHKNFPDDHFLSLHICEVHDSYRAAKAAQGEKTFACLVPTCDRFCSTPQKRRLHCIDKHHFPKDYDFFIVKDGIDQRSSMLRPHRRRSSTVNSTTSTPSRKRGDSVNAAKVDAMQIVNDDEEDSDEDDEEDQEPAQSEDKVKRTPVKLRGRGGFSHPRGGGRGRGGSTSALENPPPESTDPIESLTSRMSSLQFIPHSLYARGRGRGRGI